MEHKSLSYTEGCGGTDSGNCTYAPCTPHISVDSTVLRKSPCFTEGYAGTEPGKCMFVTHITIHIAKSLSVSEACVRWDGRHIHHLKHMETPCFAEGSGKVDVRLLGKVTSNSHSARPVY